MIKKLNKSLEILVVSKNETTNIFGSSIIEFMVIDYYF